jgi:putative nucleotidyltransferase with HDIG domain
MISEFFSDHLVMLVQRTPGDLNRLRLTILTGSHHNDIAEEYVLLSSEEQEMLFTGEPFKVLSRDISLPRFLTGRGTCDSFLFLPLDRERQVIGALILEFNISEGQNSVEQIGQARQIADQLGIALANARLVSDLERLSIGTVEALARTVDAKSKWTAGHSERVAGLAVKIGEAMNWSKERLESLFRAGLLHDIGKIGIPIVILDKPGKLSEEEYDTIKTHPTLGGKILEPIQVYKDILPLVVQHHERFDGKGYPKGLSGEEIDIGARILCVVDVYDALISQRPYRDGWVKENVLSFMRDNRGTMFDPGVVDVFLSIDV